MSKCDCYRVRKIKQSCISQITGIPFWYDVEISYCIGTKEQDRCTCNGDEAQCDFYPEIRERAENAAPNTWIITENGCVITCPNCGHRLELCYPDGTEVRYLPYCPWCGKQLEK